MTFDGGAAGDVETIAQFPSPAQVDDFDFDAQGDAWITDHPNTLYEVTMQGQIRNHTSLAITQPVSARFGRSQGQQRTLYVATSGNGTVSGQILAVNTDCLV